MCLSVFRSKLSALLSWLLSLLCVAETDAKVARQGRPSSLSRRCVSSLELGLFRDLMLLSRRRVDLYLAILGVFTCNSPEQSSFQVSRTHPAPNFICIAPACWSPRRFTQISQASFAIPCIHRCGSHQIITVTPKPSTLVGGCWGANKSCCKRT
jgi:hypothetical protein